MGAALSCFQAIDVGDEEYRRHGADESRCLCLDLVFSRILDACTALFQGAHTASHSRVAVAPELVVDDSSCDTYRPPPRPLSFDDPRCSYMYASGVISPSKKTSSHLLETTELIGDNDESDVESFGDGDKCKGYDSQPQKQAPRESEYGLLYAFPFPEEDSCPICLEEYCGENPKIILKCTHHFHLSCLYEWMERSEACPLCGKAMEFEEKT